MANDRLEDILPERGELTQRERLNRERSLPVEKIGFVTRRDVYLAECGLSLLVQQEFAPDPYTNPYGDEV